MTINYKIKLALVVVIWWSAWLFGTRLTKFTPVSEMTFYLVLSCVFAFLIGAMCPIVLDKLPGSFKLKDHCIVNYRKKKSIFSGLRVPLLIIIIQLPLLALGLKAFFTVENYRAAVFENTADIWGSLIVIYLYDMLAIPAALVYTVTSIKCNEFVGLRRKLIFLIFVLDSLIKMGRFSIYIYCIILFGAWVRGNSGVSLSVIAKFVGLVTLIAFFVFFLRYGGSLTADEINIGMYLIDSIIAYHMVGFGILDQFLTGAVSLGGDRPPLFWLGYLEGLGGSLLKTLGFDYKSNYSSLGEFLQSVFVVTEAGAYNAFGTNILPFYLDGGSFFAILVFFIYGLIMTFNPSRSNDLTRLGMIIWILMIMGIFQGLIVGPYFYSCVFLMALDWFIRSFSLNSTSVT